MQYRRVCHPPLTFLEAHKPLNPLRDRYFDSLVGLFLSFSGHFVPRISRQSIEYRLAPSFSGSFIDCCSCIDFILGWQAFDQPEERPSVFSMLLQTFPTPVRLPPLDRPSEMDQFGGYIFIPPICVSWVVSCTESGGGGRISFS